MNQSPCCSCLTGAESETTMNNERVYLFDLWMTLINGLSEDPILTLQRQLEYKIENEGSLDPEFLKACLTTDISNKTAFLQSIASRFDVRIGRGGQSKFAKLLRSERENARLFEDTIPTLTELKRRGVRIGLVSNLWAFPVERIFNEMGLGQYFEHLIFSFEVGAHKPEDAIFAHAAKQFGVAPASCVMIGDNPIADTAGARAAGMDAILLNRSGRQITLPAGTRQIQTLSELL